MKALISAFALLTFVAGTALPVESYAQTTGTGQTMAPDTSMSTAPTTTTKKNVKHPAARRYWTVQAGDTFGVISSKTGVPVATIEQLNPTVKSTSLFIGEKIRLR